MRVEAAAVAQTISIGRYTNIVRRLDAIGRRPGFTLTLLEVLRRSGHALPFFMVRAGPATGLQLCVSAGMHGDEPAGVEALLAFLELPSQPAVGITAFPCINPTGLVAGTRRNDLGLDLNRTFGQERGPQEIELVRAALVGTRFDAGVDLHEDSEARGFYLYEHVRAPRRELGPRVVAAVRAIGLPINDVPTIEERPLVDGCVEPADETLSPLVGFFSIYLFDRHSDQTLVPESPPRLPMPARVAMHIATLNTVIAALPLP
jgi:murein peptide amidase A